MKLWLTARAGAETVFAQAGGKAGNLARLVDAGCAVPEWFALSVEACRRFTAGVEIPANVADPTDAEVVAGEIETRFLAAPMPSDVADTIREALAETGLADAWVAVRSSGLEEDSAAHSFAGQFSSFLCRRGFDDVIDAVRRCWASAFSARALAYRRERGLAADDIRLGVVIQRMVEPAASGVAFSRHPVRPLDRETVIVDAVPGLGEGLVNGDLDADHFEIDRTRRTVRAVIADKTAMLVRGETGGVQRRTLDPAARRTPALTDAQAVTIADLAIRLEARFGAPQDLEWAVSGGRVLVLQARPITTLPPGAFFDPQVRGDQPILWDNSNIIESYSGVTRPLTFSFASAAYRQVYDQFCEVMGVSRDVIAAYQPVFRNMLGLVRGRIYYNLINWYRLVLVLPGTRSNKGFMDTMMGVKQSLKPELASLFDFVGTVPRASAWARTRALLTTLWRFVRIERIVGGFLTHFHVVYDAARHTDLSAQSLPQLAALYQRLDEQVLRRWQAPIINDYLCMVFFGLLKRLTEQWVVAGGEGSALQNDLLCGEGDVESTQPTKWLMRIAERIDREAGPDRAWLLATTPEAARDELRAGAGPKWLRDELASFLDRYGFRCVNELKLEEPDLHEDPSFVLDAIAGYVRTKSYSIAAMEAREQGIRAEAERRARARVTGWRGALYFWILKQARWAVRTRENLRFARTRIFGVARHLFRAIGDKLVRLGALESGRDVFYLTVEEVLAWIEGRPVTLDVRALVRARRSEFDAYERTPAPPDRLLTYGAAGASMSWEAVLADGDLLRAESAADADPDLLRGTPCCPGVVEGVVRVARGLAEAKGLAGEILVTGRTDPGWVPLFPSCRALLIERGSLLSHSAVVARELGLPTIVGISGGLMERLRTGDRVRVDAGKGEVRILERTGKR